MPLTYKKIVQEALALPGVTESTSYGTPALKVRNKLMARLKEDEETLVLRSHWEDRERLLVIYPHIFFLTDHYRPYPWVLCRLKTATFSILEPALLAAWRQSASKTLLKSYPAS